MKLNLNESLKSYDAFLNEREAQAEATADSRDAMIADVDTIITSLETLATAVTELKEDWTKEWELKKLNEDVDHPLNETMLGRWIKAKMLAKKQKKINVMKLKASDMATAANQLQGAENRDKKAYMMDKKKQLEDNVKELQAMVNDKANEIGGIAPKVINKVKMAGAIEVIKSQIGNVDPDKAKSLKQRLNDLKTKAAEEDEAIADFKAKAEAEAEDEKGDDKTLALKDQLSKLKDEKKGMPKETDKDKLAIIKKDMEIANLNAKIKAEDGDPNTDPSEDDAKLADLKKKAEELQAKIDAGGEETETETGNTETETETGKGNTETGKGNTETETGNTKTETGKGNTETETGNTETETGKGNTETETGNTETETGKGNTETETETETETGNTKTETETETGNTKTETETETETGNTKTETETETGNTKTETETETEDDDEKNKKQPKEALVIRANAAGLNELATEIDSKLDWQLAEGTGLRLKYEAAIRKAESDKTLNENRYFDNNVKDAFRRLL